MEKMRTFPFLSRSLLAGAAFLGWACSGPGRLPEGEIPPRLALPPGSRVLVRPRAASGSALGTDALSALVRAALEQSPVLDFLVPGEKDPAAAWKPGALVDLSWEPLPGSPSRWRLLAKAKRLSDGEETLLQAVPRDPGFPGLERGIDSMGRILRRTFGEPSSSILSHSLPLARAFTPDPKALAAYLEARSLVRRGRIPEAGERIQAALKRDPRFGKAMLLLASLLLDGGASFQALRELEKASLAALDMDAPDRHRMARIRLKALGKYKELLSEADRFLEEYPFSPEGFFTKALALNLLARYGDALPLWRRLHKRAPSALTPVFQLGVSLYGLGRFRKAALYWDDLARMGARPVLAAFFAALPRIAGGDPAGARARVEEFLEKAPRRASTLARFHLLLCSLSILGEDVPNADKEAARVLEAARADPAETRLEWTLAGRFLLFRGKDAQVRSFLGILPLARPAGKLEDLRLAGIWLQGLMAARDPKNSLADKAASTLSQEAKGTYAAELKAEIARVRGNPTAWIFNLRQAQGGYPSPWNDYRLAEALLEVGKKKEGLTILEAVVHKGLSLDPNNLHLHPAANPLSAAALVEARRLLARERARG